MSNKLIQQNRIKGNQEFELAGDVIHFKIKKPFQEEKTLTIMLAMLEPVPVINKSYLEFHSRVKCSPLLRLYIDNPNAEEFNAFVNFIQERAQAEYNAFAGIK